MNEYIEIDGRFIGSSFPTYIIAEMSANHNQDFEQAVEIIKAAKDVGADAVKLQTYKPDTMTIECDSEQGHVESHWPAGNTLGCNLSNGVCG